MQKWLETVRQFSFKMVECIIQLCNRHFLTMQEEDISGMNAAQLNIVLEDRGFFKKSSIWSKVPEDKKDGPYYVKDELQSYTTVLDTYYFINCSLYLNVCCI